MNRTRAAMELVRMAKGLVGDGGRQLSETEEIMRERESLEGVLRRSLNALDSAFTQEWEYGFGLDSNLSAYADQLRRSEGFENRSEMVKGRILKIADKLDRLASEWGRCDREANQLRGELEWVIKEMKRGK